MSDEAVREARRALTRLRRAAEKTEHELAGVMGALRHAEGADFPIAAYETASDHLRAVFAFVDDEAERLEEKVLHAGGLEPGRVRRSGGV